MTHFKLFSSICCLYYGKLTTNNELNQVAIKAIKYSHFKMWFYTFFNFVKLMLISHLQDLGKIN